MGKCKARSRLVLNILELCPPPLFDIHVLYDEPLNPPDRPNRKSCIARTPAADLTPGSPENTGRMPAPVRAKHHAQDITQRKRRKTEGWRIS